MFPRYEFNRDFKVQKNQVSKKTCPRTINVYLRTYILSPRSFLSSIAHCERSWERRSRGKEQGVVKGEQRGPDRRRSFHTGREFWEIINIVQHSSLPLSALSVSRAVKRTVNGQARKRARGSPRRHLTLPLGEEVLLPLFKASLPSSHLLCRARDLSRVQIGRRLGRLKH